MKGKNYTSLYIYIYIFLPTWRNVSKYGDSLDFSDLLFFQMLENVFQKIIEFKAQNKIKSKILPQQDILHPPKKKCFLVQSNF
jgi:hypothetical protein